MRRERNPDTPTPPIISMTAEPQRPQLVMRLDDLSGLPEPEPPEGYLVRHFQPGDAQAWCDVIAASFGGERTLESFEKSMRGDPAFRPERIWLAFRGDKAAATASAWRRLKFGPDAGYLHMVGCKPECTGKGLGRAVSLAALRQMAREGRSAAVLETDDFRLPAIRLYLRLGFKPFIVHENQPDRWRRIFEALGRPELAEEFAAELNAEPWSPEPPAQDAFDLSRFATRRIWNAGRPHKGGRTGGGDIDCLGDESLYRGRALGEAGCSLAEVPAGADQPFTLWFRCGEQGLPAGASVLFAVRGQRPLGAAVQAKDPRAPGYLELAGPPHAALSPYMMGFRVDDGALRPGDRVELHIGRTAGFEWTPLAHKIEFKVIVQTHPAEPQMRLPEPVVVRVQPGEPESADVFVHPTPRGDRVRVVVSARDEHDNRVPLDGTAALQAGDETVDALMVNGLAQGELPAPAAAVRVRAKLPKVKGAFRSNPCVPGQELRLFIGDLHAHDFLNEAEGYSDEVYRWAIEDKALDFLSVPLQSHSYHDNERWLLCKYMNERFLDEGRFVTFLAFEWQHSHYGDKVIHFLNGDQPYLPLDDPRYASPAGLYEALRGSDALVISHHPGYELDRHVPGTDWSAVETDVDRLVEIWSMHGSSEGYDPADRPLRAPCAANTAMAALRRGVRVGLVAGSDTHSARPGGAVKEPLAYYPGGLCAVWAEALTRRALFDALRARRTYALTRGRIVLDFRVNDAWMGSEIPFADRVRIRVKAWGQSDIGRVEIMKNAAAWKTLNLGYEEADLEFEDELSEPAFYHCRITQMDGELAVCSPVWVG